MKIELVDYYLWNCDYCGNENAILWMSLQAGTYCGVCQRPLIRPDTHGQVVNSAMGAGRCLPCFSC